jgi:pyruvate/2-oxoglutarate dehydrogenase complex dihydrolipoamide dehydrogenase (E3) component
MGGVKTMAEEQHTCDLVVVGGGPGGYVAAIRQQVEGHESGG